MATVENKAFLFSRYDPPLGRLAGFAFFSGDCCLPGLTDHRSTAN
jgi:hypothetical protein